MEDNTQRKNKFQQVYSQMRTSFFNIMFELLKEKNTGIFLGCFIILIMFIQIVGLLFEPDKFAWKDPFFMTFVIQLCNYCRIIKAINDADSLFFYWALMFFGIFYILTMIVLLIYMNYFLKNRKHYVETVVKILRIMILLLYWVFYMPFFESFISILQCNNGYHYLDTSLQCFQGVHIFYFVICIIFLILLFASNIVIAMLYNETQPVQEDCLSRLESSFEVALVIYRSIIATFSNFCGSTVCSWVLISVYIISSAMLCYQYYKQIPYYNSFVSVFCGSLIFTYFWISINALLMKLLNVDGQIVIIFVGIPLIVLLVKNLREKRIETLMKTNIDKLKLGIDALIQVHNMTDFSKGLHKDETQRMTMIGIVNLHIIECQNADCPCKEESELYDVTTNQFTERNRHAPHQDEVFLNHFIKRLYEDALNKFINSPSIHIAFAFFLFKVMKNIHSSLVELNIAIKKKPSLQQQFTIFRYKNIIEEYIRQDHLDHKYVYPELTNVIEFERLFGEMQKAVEKVCNLQVEFWTHLTTVVPDLNILNELGKKIYSASQEADFFWALLCKINPNYQQALNLYGEYLKEIRNHEHLGNTFIDKAYNTMNAKKSVDEHIKTSDVLFNEDTTVLHVSGNKESIGKILKTSQGLSKVFGYSKTEVIGHSINILMPTLFAKKHTDFMERFFRTGRQVIFYTERTLFATHRNGHCFQMKLLVKQMPTLSEGIQYVGMIKPLASDYDYMLTDMDGIIDSFSKGITGLLGLTPNLFKDKDSQINIQILAPELIQFFLETQAKGRAAKSKYREAGGDSITLVVPRDFHIIAKSEAKSNTRAGGRNRGNRGQANNNRNRSGVFKSFLKALSKPKKLQRDKMPTTKQIMTAPEYINFERKKDVQCEITCLDIKTSNVDSMRMFVFKFSKNDKENKKKGDIDDMMVYNPDENNKAYVNEFEAFKMISEETESIANPKYKAKGLIQSADPLKDGLILKQNESRKLVQFSEGETAGAYSTLIKGGLNNTESPDKLAPQATHKDSLQVIDKKATSLKELEQAKSASFNINSNQSSAHQDSQNSQQSDKKPLMSKRQSSKKDSQHSYQKEEEKKEEQQEKLVDQTNLSTPRQDVSALRLESAQKEKESFLEDLKKHSFILSEHSTQKMEAKDNIVLNDQQKQEKKSFEQQQNSMNQVSQNKQSHSSLNQIPDQMVKKINVNNMNIDFDGDDDVYMMSEMVESSRREKDHNSDDDEEDQESESRKSSQKESKKKSNSDEDDDDEEKEDQASGDESDESKKKKNSDYDSEENEEDYEEKAHKSRSSKGSHKHGDQHTEKHPLLGSNDKFESPPNMNDLRRGFGEEEKEENNDDYQDHILYKPSDHNRLKVNGHEGQDNHQDKKMMGTSLFNKSFGDGNGLVKKMGMVKKDTLKIKTNPKYKCIDEVSNDGDEAQKIEDFQQLSSKELDFRETVLKFDKKRKKKERRQKEKEQKKLKAMHGEDTSSAGTRGGEADVGSKTPGGDDDEVESEESDTSSEETKEGNTATGAKKVSSHQQNDEGDVSSVTTRQNKTERNHYILRMAIDEKFIPGSIKNLRYAAYIIFFILLMLAVVYYVIQISLYDKINQNIKNIDNSEQRLNYIIDITLRTRTLILVNRGYEKESPANLSALVNSTISELRSAATNLKNAQTDLSLATAKLSVEQLLQINPNNVTLLYPYIQGLPNTYSFSIWEAIMEIVVSAYRISTTSLSQITDINPNCYFIIQNCLNSVLQSLKTSTTAIIDQSNESRTSNMQIFLYLLIAASCSLFISLVFLIPVINKVKKNKQEVLELFTHKNIEKHIDDQLKVCRNFVSMKLQQNNDAADHDIDGEDGNMNVNDKELQNELNNNKYMKRIKKKNKGKKWKKLNTDFGSTLLKFLLFLCIIQGYFLAMYLLSFKFLNQVQDLTQELNLLIQRQPTQSFLLLIQIEMIYNNGTSQIEGQDSISYVDTYQESLYDEEESLLDQFSSNYNYHSDTYNTDFNNIIYSNVCSYVNYTSTADCNAFNQGILQKGIYSSVIKYWDLLRQLNHDFLESNRTNATIINFLNDDRLNTAETMQDYYFKIALAQLVSQLESDIDTFFSIQYIQNRTIFIIYIIYIAILYFMIWRKFVIIMQNELWKTKSMLRYNFYIVNQTMPYSVLPTKLCFEIDEIRQFIYSNSSNDFLSAKI